MKKLYIVRGLPGSGKSTLAKTLAGDRVAETDMFFIKDGHYTFDGKKLADAHKWCLGKVELFMLRSLNNIAVANTFTCKWEYEKYIELANYHDFKAIIIECQNNFGSIHEVPENVIDKMRDRFER